MKRWGIAAKISVGAFVVLVAVSAITVVTTALVNAKDNSRPPTYAALGDSVAAGAGLSPPGGQATDDAACGRSAVSYPYLLTRKLNATLHDVACSGATISNGILGAQTISSAGVTMPSQLDRAFQGGVPDIMTVTIGANDAHWVDFVSKCYVETCGTLKDTATAAGYLTYLQGQLAYVLHQIKDRSGMHAPPKVFVTGYYYPVSSTACLGGTLDQNEFSWINAQTDNLNKAIRQTIAATTKVSSWFRGSYNFATYVPVSFTGHGLCSTDPWVQGPADPAPLHPTTAGARAYSDALYAAIR